MGGTDGNERKGIKIGINRCDSGNHDAETYYSTQRTSAESSYRKMIVSDYTISLLKRQKSIYLRNKMKYGDCFCDSKRVICKENGEPFLPKSFTRKWARTLEKYGLRHIKLHGTRHSAISLLLSEGVPIQMVQQRAGHQDPKITLSVYSHVARDKETLVAEKLNNVLFSAVNQ